MRLELISFEAKDGLNLRGLFFLPKAKTKRAILYLHGLGGNFYSSSIEQMAKVACSKNIAFLAIQQRGSHIADELEYTDGNSLLAGSAFESFEESEYDIYGSLFFLKKKGFSQIVIVSKSTGCQKAIYFLYKNKRKVIAKIKGLLLLSPVDDRNYDIENHKRSGKDFYSNIVLAKKLEKKDKNAIMPKELLPEDQWPISASRFLSVAEEKRVEGKLLDYTRGLKEFKSIEVPIIAVFGSKDKFMINEKNIHKAAERLKENKYTRKVLILNGANHSLEKNGKFPSKFVIKLASELFNLKK
jgi:pimeloyl-ACP methyl ester carboxylesterase